jgi:hypothetical protein
MTAKTSQHLADALRAAGFDSLAQRAEADEFHDFLSPHTFPEMQLDAALVELIQSETGDRKTSALAIRSRHHNGEFDASNEESDDWAASAEGQAAFNELTKGKKS